MFVMYSRESIEVIEQLLAEVGRLEQVNEKLTLRLLKRDDPRDIKIL